MRDILLIFTVVLCSLCASVLPAFGMLAFVFFSIFNPHSFAWSFARTFPFAQCLAVSTFLGYALWFRPKRLPLRTESTIMLALWALFVVTTIYANYPDIATLALKRISKVLLMVFLSTSVLNTPERLRWLIRVIAVALGLHALRGGLFFVFTGGRFMVFGPEDSFLESNNSFGLALAMNVPLLHHLAKMESQRWFRRLLWIMLVFTIPATLGTYSRGAWVGLAVGLALVVLRTKRKYLILGSVAVACILALPFLPEKVHQRYEDLRNYREESSAQSRFWSWEFALRVGLAHPFLGAGFDYYGIEAYARYYPEFLERWPGKVWSCHSVWLTVFSEHGFPGFCLFILLLLSCLLSLRSLKARARKAPEHAWVFPYVLMLEGSFAVFVISGTFFDAAYFDMFYQLVAVVVLLKELCPSVRTRLETSQFRMRVARRLSVLPEILFALTRHWFIILLSASLGATALLDMASKLPPFYLGKAMLLFPEDQLVLGPGSQDRRPPEERPLSAQIQLLRSDSVARKVAQAAKVFATVSTAPQAEAGNLKGLGTTPDDFKEAVVSTTEALQSQRLQDTGGDLQTQRAVADFRARSEVVPYPLTHTVELRIRGNSRHLVLRELDEWINAFVGRLAELAGESRDAFIDSRRQYWGQLQQKARDAVEAFRRENPDVTNANQNLINQEIIQLQLLRIFMHRRLNIGQDQQSRDEPALEDDPETSSLLLRKRSLEAELTQAYPLYADGSERIQNLRQSIEILESIVSALEAGKRESLAEELEKVDEAIREAREHYAVVGEKHERLQALEEELNRYEQTWRSYEILDMEWKDKEELSRSAQVQVSDKPQVSWLPTHVDPFRYGFLGALAGIVFGMSLSAFIELLTGKVRFKNDVLGEFGLPVVAVIPRK